MKHVLVLILMFCLLAGCGGTSAVTDTSISKTIAASKGGSIELSDGTRVDFPPDTLTSDVKVSVSIPTQLPSDIVLPAGPAPIIREISAADVSLKRPVSLTFSYADLPRQDALAPDAVFVARWDDDHWEYLGGDVDAQHQKVTIEVSHLSLFGVFAVPSPDTLFSWLGALLAECNVECPEVHEHWTQLVRNLAQANDIVLPSSVANLRVCISDVKNFQAIAQDGVILANPEWFKTATDWLPESKRDLLAASVLGHELSHIVQGTTDVQVALQLSGETGFWREAWERSGLLGKTLLKLLEAIGARDCAQARRAFENFRGVLDNFFNKRPICGEQRLEEIRADNDGVIWAGHLYGDVITVGLVTSHRLDRSSEPASCLHPSGADRAERIRDLLQTDDGGLYGKVIAKGRSAAGVELSANGVSTVTDEEGMYLLAPISASGKAPDAGRITLSKPGCRLLTLNVVVPEQDLAEAHFEFSCTPEKVDSPVEPASPEEVDSPIKPASPGFITFHSYRSGGNQIYVMSADGSEVKRLTNARGDNVFPSWSPDGTRIAFQSSRDSQDEVYVMALNGSGQTNLTRHPAGDQHPCWSPDGRQIAFSSNRDGDWEIYVMSADGGSVSRLTNQPGDDLLPAWSPDGSRIAFASFRDGNPEVYVMNADGSAVKNLTNHPSLDLEPAWSPDGRHIAFSSDRSGNGEVYIMKADGTAVTNLTKHPDWDLEPCWSPDGSRIAFTSYRDGNPEIYFMNADGSGVKNITKDPAEDWAPAWSP